MPALRLLRPGDWAGASDFLQKAWPFYGRMLEAVAGGAAMGYGRGVRVFLASILGLGLSAGLAQEGDETRAEGPVKSAYFRCAIFFVPEPLADPVKTASAVRGDLFAGQLAFKDDSRPVRSGVHVAWQRKSTAEYPVPAEDILQWKGVGLAENAAELLGRSQEVIAIEFLAADPVDYEYIGWSNRFLHEVARRTGGYIWDNETRQMFSVTAWKEWRLETAPRDLAISNTTIQGHPDRDPDRVRAITLGMRKFGHPDFAVDGFVRGNWLPMGDLLYFLMSESARSGPFRVRRIYSAEELRDKLNFPTGSLVPPLALVPAERQSGDPDNLVLTLDWSIYPGDSIREKQQYLIENLLVPDPELRVVREHQKELLVLSALARERLEEKRTTFHKGLTEGEEIRVKAWHRGEYAWMKILDWEREQLECALIESNTRYPQHRAGDRVRISFDDVFDYLHLFPDGRTEGNDTGRAIEALLERERAASAASGSGEKK